MLHRLTALVLLISSAGTAFAQSAESQGKPVEIAKSYSLPSAVLGQTRTINIYLPPSYDQGSQAYPVLFLLDGGIKEDFLHIVGLASTAAPYTNIREFIVIGIEGIDRRHDFTAPSKVDKDRELIPNAGGSAKFREFLDKELLPWAKGQVRMTEETVLIGESAAALFATETFLRQPDLFQGYIAISPSLWWDAQSLAKEAANLLQKQPYPANRRYFLTIGSEGSTMDEGVEILAKALKTHGAKDLKWTYSPMRNEDHGTIFHPAALAAIRLFFATPTKYK